ncbi:MAG: hypothetical protein RLZZ360_422 [Candidatus Parcubacteria bacterium]|jgi:hypothetical protein
MLHVFWLVLVDLWHFLLGTETVETRTSTSSSTPVLSSRAHYTELPGKTENVALHKSPSPLSLPVADAALEATESPEVVLPLQTPTITTETLNKPGMLYVVRAITGTKLFKEPVQQFDSQLRTLPYGQIVALRHFEGQYAEVLAYGQVGFVHKDALTPELETIWPTLVSGTVYLADSEVAKIYRQHIADEFLGGAIGLPLTAEEYVTVRLLRDRLAIAWPPARPRLAGSWHTLLRGVSGVRSMIAPQPDTIIEWFLEDEVGRLGYVEAVLPDETLKISAVGAMVPGEYTESIVPAAVWREWRPVFINVR